MSAPEAARPKQDEPAAQPPIPAPSDLWPRLQSAVRARIQPEQFETWFRRAAIVHIDEEVLRLAVQNAFARDWLQQYYPSVLSEAPCWVSRPIGLPSAALPVASVPMKLPSTTLEDVPKPLKSTPATELPEMTLR